MNQIQEQAAPIKHYYSLSLICRELEGLRLVANGHLIAKEQRHL